ncbi:4900_t:CDS:1 [Paraglomus occultum]|uniref:4900_t:CDS:1 n=1 Tax=Paraglomus occultum TaxID=144539 RepID=A0A9N8YXM8_9GLOM|nr:4900_t:CDS:1 [Paraglomus occultum]
MDDSIDTSVLNEGIIFSYNDDASDDDDSYLAPSLMPDPWELFKGTQVSGDADFRPSPPVVTRMNTMDADRNAKKEQTANDKQIMDIIEREIAEELGEDEEEKSSKNIVCDQEIIVNPNIDLPEDDEVVLPRNEYSGSPLYRDIRNQIRTDPIRSCEETELIFEEMLSEGVEPLPIDQHSKSPQHNPYYYSIDNSPNHVSRMSNAFEDNELSVISNPPSPTSPRDPERDVPAMSEETEESYDGAMYRFETDPEWQDEVGLMCSEGDGSMYADDEGMDPMENQ